MTAPVAAERRRMQIRQRVDAFFSVPVAQFKDFPVLSIIKRHDEVLLPWKSDLKFIARPGRDLARFTLSYFRTPKETTALP